MFQYAVRGAKAYAEVRATLVIAWLRMRRQASCKRRAKPPSGCNDLAVPITNNRRKSDDGLQSAAHEELFGQMGKLE